MQLIWKSDLGDTEQRWTAIVAQVPPSSASANEVFSDSSRDTYASWSISDSTRHAQRFGSALVLNVFMTGG